jgi:hypothetical protein
MGMQDLCSSLLVFNDKVHTVVWPTTCRVESSAVSIPQSNVMEKALL